MNTDQFKQIIDAIKNLSQRIDHLAGRIDRMGRRINVMSGIYLAGLVFILTGVGIYTNVVLMVQNLE